MKKFLLLLTVAFIATFQVKAQQQKTPQPFPNDTANYPYWIQMMQDPSVNFFKVQKAFTTYWKNRKVTKGCGWKPFKRWEYMMQSRILPDGTRPAADVTFNAYRELRKSVQSSHGAWVSLGPSQIPEPGPAGYEGLGRINTVGFHPTDPNKIFVGTPAGGMWQSADGGATWVSHTDSLATLGVSAIIVDRINPNVIFIGTGDRDAGDAPGMGVFKSSDGGVTWVPWNTGMGNKTVGRMLQHPTNNQIMIAATSGGVYRTINGGANWTLSIGGDYKDCEFKPNDPNIVYATSGPNFWRSSNNGVAFTMITAGLSGGQRASIAVTPADANYVYLLISGNDSGFKGFYRSTDAGVTFNTRSTSPNILDWSCDCSGTGGQGWYDLAIAASPTVLDEVYIGGVDIWRSTNGGAAWNINAHWYGGCSVPAVHADCHFLGYNPVNGKLYTTVDGGVYSTANNGLLWTDHTVGMTIGEIYKLGQSMTLRDEIINGFQDNGSYTYTSNGWLATGGGDGMECAVDYSDATYTYYTIYYGDIYRRHNNAAERHVAGNGINGINESGGWVTPFILHKTDPNTMFVGYKNVWRTNTVKANGTISFVKISADLAGNNAVDMAVLEQSTANPNILYAARSDNRLFRTDNCNDANPVWVDLTTFLPAGASITDMESHPTEPNTLYATMGTTVYKTTDKGHTWTNLSANLTNIHLSAIVFYKNAPEGLYVGSDAGVYYKDTTMTSWINFSQGLPVNGRVTELEIFYDNDSVSRDAISASTYGRGLWQSDMYHTAPHAEFIASQTVFPTGCSIGFKDLSTGIPTYWQWTFTGGVPSTSSVKNPSGILYATPGIYPVKMKTWNEFGTDSITKTGYITVSGTLTPTVNFTADKHILCQGEFVQFTDSTQNCPISWNWSFSPNTVTFLNGTSATSQNPTVQFDAFGGYDVTLTAWNGVGSNNITKTMYIINGGYALPFEEAFESGFSSKYWTVVNPDEKITWDTITTGGTTPGSKSVWVNMYNYAGINNRDQLISPPMTFMNWSSVTLNFEHAYAQRSQTKDSLIVYISTDCGSTWTRILSAGPSAADPNIFSTHAPTSSAFYPLTADDWCGGNYGTNCYSIDLTPWTGLSNIKLMFESYSRHGNNLFLDNIQVTGPLGIPSGIKGDLGVKIYPNPSDGSFNLYVAKANRDIDIALLDLQGQAVYESAISAQTGSVLKKIDLKNLSKGMYYLRLTSSETTQIEKIIIQ